MKLILAIFVSVVLSLSCRAAEKPVETKRLLVWDATSKTNTAKAGDLSSRFDFVVRNVSTNIVEITDITTSCGCTVASMPENPWRIKPGETNHLPVLADLRGKTGSIFKDVNISSKDAPEQLHVMVNIEDISGTNTMSKEQMDRLWAQQMASVDRQAVFSRKECQSCHLTPAFGKHGKELYDVACGICHDSEHRATMVPDLHALKTPIAANYYSNMVAHGKPGTLMPAFLSREGGPLDVRQIASLVEFLNVEYPRPAVSETK